MAKRLFEAIIEANHRAVAGDAQAGVHPADFEDELPLVALSCVDVRLNNLLPQVLGVPAEQFIWLRNAGNIITGPMSSTMRSLALACAVKGGKEIVIIGHTDCQVGKTTAIELIDRFRALGIERHMLPDNLNEFFGIFGSDRQNVVKAAEIARSSSLVGPKVPVQGLLVEIDTGRVEWVVNGYQTLGSATSLGNELLQTLGSTLDSLKPLGFNLGEMKFPETKIGEVATRIGNEILQRTQAASATPSGPAEATQAPGSVFNVPAPTGFNVGELRVPPVRIGEVITAIGDDLSQRLRRPPAVQGTPAQPSQSDTTPPKIPIPPPIRPRMHLRRNPK